MSPSYVAERHSLDNGDRGQIYCEYFYDTTTKTQNGIVFLVDGVCNDGFQFATFIHKVTRSHAVIRFDYRGHGRSSDAPKDKLLTVDICVSDMKRVLAHFYRTHPTLRKKARHDRVTLISYSLGAQVALRFAASEENRVNGIGIINGTLEPAFYGLFRSETVSDGIVYLLRRSASFQRFVAFCIRIGMLLLSLNGFISSLLASYFVRASAKNFKPFWAHARRVQARSYLSFLVDAHTRDGLDILEYFGDSSVSNRPLLLCVVGMKDTLVRTEKTVQTIRNIAPECEILKIESGCHALLVHDDHKEKMAAALVAFVNRCAATTGINDDDTIDEDTMNAVLC